MPSNNQTPRRPPAQKRTKALKQQFRDKDARDIIQVHNHILSVEGKILFKVLADQFTEYLLRIFFIARLIKVPRTGYPVNSGGMDVNLGDLSVPMDPFHNGFDNIAHSRDDQGTHTGLLQESQDEIYLLHNNFCVAFPKEGHQRWLHHISGAVSFMDNLTVISTTVAGCCWLLQGLESLMTWA